MSEVSFILHGINGLVAIYGLIGLWRRWSYRPPLITALIGLGLAAFVIAFWPDSAEATGMRLANLTFYSLVVTVALMLRTTDWHRSSSHE